jgi:hypothetical protein
MDNYLLSNHFAPYRGLDETKNFTSPAKKSRCTGVVKGGMCVIAIE